MSWLPEEYLRSTVMILELENVQESYEWDEINEYFLGTGFLIDYCGLTTLITNRHVVFNTSSEIPKSNLFLAYESTQNNPELINIQANQGNDADWVIFEDENLDIAVTPIHIIRDYAYVNFLNVSQFANIDSVRLGEDIFFIGFPLGLPLTLTPDFHVNPIVRKGIISFLHLEDSQILLDATAVGGSSGSPIFIRNDRGDSCLLGIIQGYYRDFRFDDELQLDLPIHSNLAFAVTIDRIEELLERTFEEYPNLVDTDSSTH